MNQSEFERQTREVQANNGGFGGNALGKMKPTEGVGAPIRTMWCGEEEQKKFK